MPSRFEPFVSELDRSLRGLPQAERREICEETRQHLEELAAEVQRGAEELSPAEAEAIALSRFGDAGRVGSAMRRQTLRRICRRSAHQGVLLLAFFAASISLTVGVCCAFGAPLLLDGQDISWLYVLLGVLLTLSQILRRPNLTRGIVGIIAACLLAPLALHLHQGMENYFLGALPPFQPGEGATLSFLHHTLADGFLWSLDAASLHGLLPAQIVAGPLWGRRLSARRALLATVVLYALAGEAFNVWPLLARSYLTVEGLHEYMINLFAPWAIQGLIVGALLLGARTLYDALARIARPAFKALCTPIERAGRRGMA